MAATHRNGGQEFGELKAQVAGLVDSFRDHRDETRRAFEKLETSMIERINDHTRRLGVLESAKTYLMGRIAGAVGVLTLLGGAAWGAFELVNVIFIKPR